MSARRGLPGPVESGAPSLREVALLRATGEPPEMSDAERAVVDRL